MTFTSTICSEFIKFMKPFISHQPKELIKFGLHHRVSGKSGVLNRNPKPITRSLKHLLAANESSGA